MFAPATDWGPPADHAVLVLDLGRASAGDPRSEVFLEWSERDQVPVREEAREEGVDFWDGRGAAHV